MEGKARLTRWAGGAAVALAAVLLVASCGDAAPGRTSGAAGAPAAQTGHAGHAGHAAAQPPPTAPLRPGERFMTLTVPEPYRPSAPSGGTDEYRCFLVDPGLTGPAFLTGSRFLPQNTDIVHHAIIFRVGPKEAEAARRADAATPGEGWTCFGDAGIENGAWVGSWAPGVDETLLRQKVGYPLPAGSQMVLQIHYNLLGGAGGTDRSGIRLRLADDASGRAPLETGLIAGPIELPCTAEESGPLCERKAAVEDVAHRFGEQARQMVDGLTRMCGRGEPPRPRSTQHCDMPIREDATLYAVAGHMHLLGRSIRIDLNPGKPDARTLLDIPAYNFDDQAIRPLAQPLEIKAGDTLRVTCTHDAGLRAMLPALHGSPPRYVVWGEGTSDEMCLGLLVWSPQARSGT
ncbi:monooxygenase [Microbispora catharanthi]|uniref:Monooxygenase n=1 Tax=Microbispora catharanthi TaxID=1712871 RepID=A0A5N6BGC2_9ACTN|nr:monooxygenase [Microbispora catharanthi]KAB8180127.1 monooxygenase [Microbispora catharanthi]